jgi:hypothetical protein
LGSSELDKSAIGLRLGRLGFGELLAAEVLRILPESAAAVLLYGSRARGDIHQHSDVDLLVVAARHAKTRAIGSVNVTTYGQAQIENANGSLFGMHLARDAVILHDPDGWLGALLEEFRPSNPEEIMRRVRDIAVALKSDESSRATYVSGLVRLARYLLRTALYAKALDPGPPCFSISGLAERFGQPELQTLLSSHRAVQGEPSIQILDELQQRLDDVVGSVPPNPYLSLQALIVGEWGKNKDVANAALLALANDRDELPYAEIPRIVL